MGVLERPSQLFLPSSRQLVLDGGEDEPAAIPLAAVDLVDELLRKGDRDALGCHVGSRV
jgi:hypothetical protein